jgi:soluble lytic murein transglycosylase-like protein
MIFFILGSVLPQNAFPFCFERAGQTYGISPQLIKAIAYQESAFNSNAIHHNRNGSFDYGVMQINSWWFETLGKKRWQALSDPCFNVMVGTWILRDCIDRYGYTWDCLACYRSGKPLTALSESVRKDVIRYINRIEFYFEGF